MASSILDRVAAALFGKRSDGDALDAALLDDVIELVVDTVEPKIRYQSRYKQRLRPCITTCIHHLQALARDRFEPITLSKAAWSADPRVNAFFATGEDVRTCLGNSTELRDFFDRHPVADEAHALLVMKKEERQLFAPDTSGDRVVKDVAKVSVCFSDQSVMAPTASYQATREEVGKRIIQRLAEVALARITEASANASELQTRKAHLAARLRQLELARSGISGETNVAARIVEAKRELAAVGERYAETSADGRTLDAVLRHVIDVFSNAEQHVAAVHTPLRLDKQGFKVAGHDAVGPVNELVLAEIVLGAQRRAAIAIVGCLRTELPPKRDFLATAARYL
jgi:hypothetical protein